MSKRPHREKLVAAISNPKAVNDADILKEALKGYEIWVKKMEDLSSTGHQRVKDLTSLLNEYKDYIEVDLIASKGTDFIKRQKGQLKLDNSILEEFLMHLADKRILSNLPDFEIESGPQNAFMSLSFMPLHISSLGGKPEVILKTKDQDFTIGKSLFYKFSSSSDFAHDKSTQGQLFLAVLAAECKINYDKTMFQECAGTATRLKQGCPISKYYALVEYLDMQAEDCRLTDIDNVFLLRHAKRLPFEKRSRIEEIKKQHKEFPIDYEIVLLFVNEIQNFVDAIWYDPEQALKRGTFV